MKTWRRRDHTAKYKSYTTTPDGFDLQISATTGSERSLDEVLRSFYVGSAIVPRWTKKPPGERQAAFLLNLQVEPQPFPASPGLSIRSTEGASCPFRPVFAAVTAVVITSARIPSGRRRKRAPLKACWRRRGQLEKIAAVKTFIATGRTRQVRGENLVPIE
jgi:hypothetical protein